MVLLLGRRAGSIPAARESQPRGSPSTARRSLQHRLQAPRATLGTALPTSLRRSAPNQRRNRANAAEFGPTGARHPYRSRACASSPSPCSSSSSRRRPRLRRGACRSPARFRAAFDVGREPVRGRPPPRRRPRRAAGSRRPRAVRGAGGGGGPGRVQRRRRHGAVRPLAGDAVAPRNNLCAPRRFGQRGDPGRHARAVWCATRACTSACAATASGSATSTRSASSRRRGRALRRSAAPREAAPRAPDAPLGAPATPSRAPARRGRSAARAVARVGRSRAGAGRPRHSPAPAPAATNCGGVGRRWSRPGA